MRVFLTTPILSACTSCSRFWDNIQVVGEGYQNKFGYRGTLEKKYAYDGTGTIRLNCSHKKIATSESNSPKCITQ